MSSGKFIYSLRNSLCNVKRLLTKKEHNYVKSNLIMQSLRRVSNSSIYKNKKENIVTQEDGVQYTHFGYEKVAENIKSEKVHDVFKNVADSYDLMNDLMSAGTHRVWKEYFVKCLNLKSGMKILDMAGGTGDIAFKMLDHAPSSEPTIDIVISDINQAMLDVGKKRACKLGIAEEFKWVCADAESLPFEDESFDLYTIAFGIRNTTHIDKVLDEAYRVLKPGGRFSCLEFSNVSNPLIRSIYDAYSFQVIPVMGELFASDWKSYQYLVESIRQFPDQEAFSNLIYNAGFSNVTYHNLTFGVVSIHDGFKL
ncbi:2-methoxy-6-polyprenyl-1,4-benzoquinol methylase, mitochondrial [Hydra vulgaris]|uniref:2-methoxy-6-polyprenyl-1,4-benzoquinol methylase, mitochondrial n=1 Tax=Hydra vulgaris TaxID=6087 RepID=A0ABM4CPZ3_HYDVU